MPACYLIATVDAQLASAWERQIPLGRQCVRLPAPPFERGVPPGVSAILLLDAAEEERFGALMTRHPAVFVGEPLSVPFEQARIAGKARLCLSYEESTRRLRDLLPLLEEIADRGAMTELLQQRMKRSEPESRPSLPPQLSLGISPGGMEWWDFVEGAVESLDSRERLLGEFRRAARRLLRASHAVFFLREGDGFRADKGGWQCRFDDPLVQYLEGHPAVIDGRGGMAPADPLVELALRNHLVEWGAKLLVPIHDNGRLLGFIVLGVRDDGLDYDADDNGRAVGLARLLRQLLVRHDQLSLFEREARRSALAAKYLPSSLLLGAGDKIPGQVPVAVRDLVGQVRHFRDGRRLEPEPGQPYRASAGPIEENGGVWVTWEEASEDLRRQEDRRMDERRSLLRELALTLCHEMGNPLVSLSTFRQMTGERAVPKNLIQTICHDVERLEGLERCLSLMQTLSEVSTETVDMTALAKRAVEGTGIAVEGGGVANIRGKAHLLEFCLKSIIASILENRPKTADTPLSLSVKTLGNAGDLAALLSFRGAGLELEGVLPEMTADSTPSQGRMPVFLAKEIIRLHLGEIHAGPGMGGMEIMITFRSL